MPALAHQHQEDASNISSPMLLRARGKKGARLFILDCFAITALEVRERHLEIVVARGLVGKSQDAKPPLIIFLQRDESGFRDGQFENERARVIRYAAHDVKAARSAGDDDFRARVKERSCLNVRVLIKRAQSFDERLNVRCRTSVAANDLVISL